MCYLDLPEAVHHKNIWGQSFLQKVHLQFVFYELWKKLLAEGKWQNFFKVKAEVFTREEKAEWIAKNTNVAVGSDAFFPFGDNIERARKSGVTCVVQPGGSVRDDLVIKAADDYNMVMCFNGIRLFHH